MAAYQALDALELVADEHSPLCHPADDPAIRLIEVLRRVEVFMHRRKVSCAVFSGFGPTAAASAICCHARGCRGLWLRPPDPAGLVPRLRLEAGLERLISATAPVVQTWQAPEMPPLGNGHGGGGGDLRADLTQEVPGLRGEAPSVLIAVLRREWGTLSKTTSVLARAATRWAAGVPEVDWLVSSNLNMRMEGPLRALKDRPANLLIVPPLPYAVFRSLLARTRVVLTDSALIAGEALRSGKPVAALADEPGDPPGDVSGLVRPLTPEDLDGEATAAWISKKIGEQGDARIMASDWADSAGGSMTKAIETWLAET